ncbi:MAG: WxcM-like domain-containing protein [Candidatus Omnitrophica bacterium]|nr:WxcM-like domain-containing protein [Candidatus Omnitrophota bacterium]
MDYQITKIEKHSDVRGQLVVFLRNSELKARNKKFGQIYFVSFNKKGIVRGNHYHKKWREWFGIVHGRVAVELEHVLTGERVSLKLDSEHSSYVRLEIGPNIAHAFKSLSDSVSLLNYGDKEWSAKDSHHYQLLKGGKK